MHDSFVVKYTAGAQRHLPLHTDQSTLSLTIALNGGMIAQWIAQWIAQRIAKWIAKLIVAEPPPPAPHH